MITEQMEIVRRLDHIGQKLRIDLKIPLSQPLLDFAFGGKYISKEYINILGESLNIWKCGKKFSDRDWYYGFDVVKPDSNELEKWKIIEEDGCWIGFNVNIPNWLEKIYKERRAERKRLFNKFNKK